MRKNFGQIKSRAEREAEKKANVKNQSMSFAVSPNLKKEIDKLMEESGFENRSEFLRSCVSINKTLINYAKLGMVELVVQTPGGNERRFIHLGHLLKIKKD
jgi:hypothetical protein